MKSKCFVSGMKATIFVMAVAMAGAPTASRGDDAKEAIQVHARHREAIYRKGERVDFEITAPGLQEVAWYLGKEGFPPVKQGRIPLVDGRGIVSGVLEEPGFLACRVTGQLQAGGHAKSVSSRAAAAVSPEELKASAPPPDDFEDFWATQKALLATISPTLKSTSVPSNEPEVESADIRVASLGAPVSGYYSKARNAQRGRHAAILTVHGYGVGGAKLDATTRWAREGLLALDINAHGLPNGQPEEFYKTLAEDYLQAYTTRQKVSRDHHYFVGLYLRVLRALDFLASQPEWDGRHLIIQGSSQGGAQAVVGAGLDSRVSLFVAGVPAYADVTGGQTGRISGWPKFVHDENGLLDPCAVEVARYFDLVNFVRLTQAEGAFTVGFLDPTSPPSTVYVLYNTHTGRKMIFNDINTAHRNSPEAIRWMRNAVINHLKAGGTK